MVVFVLTNRTSCATMKAETGKDGAFGLENNYKIREAYVEEWKARLSPEAYEALVKKGIDIEDVIRLGREWDIALQRMLDQLEVKS